MSNRLCDLCGHEIQDICLAAIEHSIPVIRYARCSDIAIEDAARECNDLSNLRVAHRSCNVAKLDMTREEWYAKGLNDREKPRYRTDIELLEFQFRMGAGGRKNVELGILDKVRTPEHQSKAGRVGGRIGGRVQGRKNVENGHCARLLAEIRDLPQTKEAQIRAGRDIFKRKTGIFGMAPEQKLEASSKGGRIGGPIGGRIQGRKNVENGQLARIRAAGGRASGRIAVESGRLDRGRHTRWHVNRGIISPTCNLCNPS